MAIPISLSLAPKEITRLLKPIIGILRKIGLRILIYLDDLIIVNQDSQNFIQDWELTLAFADDGVVINWEKPGLQPSRSRKYLKFQFNSQTMTLFLLDLLSCAEKC